MLNNRPTLVGKSTNLHYIISSSTCDSYRGRPLFEVFLYLIIQRQGGSEGGRAAVGFLLPSSLPPSRVGLLNRHAWVGTYYVHSGPIWFNTGNASILLFTDFFQFSPFIEPGKSVKVLLSRTQAGPGRRVKQEQEGISPSHVQAFSGASV